VRKYHLSIRKYIFILFVSLIFSCTQESDPIVENILIITGGHEFEPSFYKIFDSFSDIKYDTISQPRFNQMISSGMTDHYSVLIFYDMWQEISEEEKQSFFGLLDKGKGMVFLHHALASYQHWGEFENIIGGKYIETDFYDDSTMKGSIYTEDITLDIKVIDKNHPVTKDIPDFSIFDEGYKYILMVPKIRQLLMTSHPDCTPTVGWVNKYKKFAYCVHSSRTWSPGTRKPLL